MTNELPAISVVVPSFNQARYLRQALESLFAQNYPRLEVMVMDGGSTDGSVDIIREFAPRLAYWRSHADAGQSAAINEGVARARGDLAGWLNSDDYLLPRALWTVGRAWARFPGQGLYIGNGLRYDEDPGRFRPFCRRHLALNRRALRFGVDYILQPATFFLRQAWTAAGGLDPTLQYGMDWDLVLRVAGQHAAVLINDSLAVGREYAATKTAGGGLDRVTEISRLVRKHTGQGVTPGVLHYMLETLMEQAARSGSQALRYHLYESMKALNAEFDVLSGNKDGFPCEGDEGDRVYVPLARPGSSAAGWPARSDLPRIGIVTPSFNQGRFLEQTLQSIFDQDYPAVESLVYDGGSSDNSVDVIKRFGDRLAFWTSERDRGPAEAINKGLRRAGGEILGWLNSDDMLAEDALQEVGRAFADDPDLDMVYGNALYVDEENRPFLADHGAYRTALYFGEIQPLDRIPWYWTYVHAVPQPTVFFRRRLLERCGALDESYHFIFDFELFWRFAQRAKVRKIERTLAFYRVHTQAKTANWNKFLVELYRFSRPLWPAWTTPKFRLMLGQFLADYMRRKTGIRPHDAWFWATAAWVGLRVWLRLGNPEASTVRLPPARARGSTAVAPSAPHGPPPRPPAVALGHERYEVVRAGKAWRSVFCSYLWPRHPGHSGGEIRDFHLVRHLLSLSRVEFYASSSQPRDARLDPLRPHLDDLHSADTLRRPGADGTAAGGVRLSWRQRWSFALRARNWPVPGPRHHLDADQKRPENEDLLAPALSRRLSSNPPDFLFVSPQSNPLALCMDDVPADTRLVMASYDVEAERLQRLAALGRGLARTALRMEARRAQRFERDNLARYDGIVAVSDRDREQFMRLYGFEGERVLTIENGVDTDYFAFVERQPTEPPEFVFVGAFTYPPNVAAAWRLLDGILPLVRRTLPRARLWIVGQGPEPALLARNDALNAITGSVPDVRPYLAQATAACIPLAAGSGTKYKILEAASAGAPVVCTPLAAEGIAVESGRHVLMAADDRALAEALVRLAQAPREADALARSARTLMEARYAWNVNLRKLDPWLERLRAMPARRATGRNPIP